MNNTDILLEGIISVEAAITAGKRKIFDVFIDKAKVEKRDRKAIRFISLLKENSIKYTLCDRDFIDSQALGNSHGGIVAKVSERSYSNLNNLISSVKSGGYLVMLDGVEDPFNFGYSIRNLFAFGCKGFIMPERNWMSAANVVSTSSAGASELCDMSVAPSDNELITLLKNEGVDIVCAGLSSKSVSLFEFRPQRPFVLFIGGEKRGISKELFENADSVIHIPYSNESAKYSLPTASCAAIFGSYLASIK